MSHMFEPGFCYPSDSYGERYVEFEGEVISVDWIKVNVLTKEHGILSGYVDDHFGDHPNMIPTPGDIATIRCYDSGGGWYPDDRIVRWIHKPLESVFNEND